MMQKSKRSVLSVVFLVLIVAFTALVACADVTFDKITVSGCKTEFAWGEEFSLGDAKVVAVYSDGTKKTLNSDDYIVDSSTYDKTQAGSYSIKVEYNGKQTSYDVVVKAPEVTSIMLSGYKTEFEWGEEFSVGDLVVTKVYADGTTVVCNSAEYTVNSLSYNKNKSGSYTVKISLGGTYVSKSYDVVVKQAPMIGLELEGYKSSFAWGEDFSVGSLAVKAVYQDGTKSIIDSGYDIDSSLFDKNKSDQYSITVSYAGFTQEYTVNVFAPKLNGIRVELLQDNYRWGTVVKNLKLAVYKVYQDGSEVKASLSEYTVDGSTYNANSEGSYEVVIKLNATEYQDTVTVNVNAPHILSIKISSNKTEFEWDEEFVFDGAVRSVYVDGTEKTLSEDEYEVDSLAYDSRVSGEYEIVVTHKETSIKKSYTVTVAKPPITDISVSGYKNEFTSGEDLIFDGIVVTATRKNGETEQLGIDDLTFDNGGYNGINYGKFTVTVYYKNNADVYTSFEINVKERKVLKLLMIGNSFSDDTSQYVPQILKELGYEFEIGNMYIGGCSISTHYSNLLANNANYNFRYYESAGWNETYGGVKQTLEYAIKFKDWDIITFQQASNYSGISSSYSDLKMLVDAVKRRATNKNVQFVFNMTWAYQQNSTHSAFPTYNSNQITMYNSIVNAVKSQVDMPVIPNGTAIQNARTSFVGDNLTRDGYHLTLDFGRYVAGLTLVAALTGKDINTVTYKPSGVSEEYATVAKESATNAIKTPFAITDSKYASVDDIMIGGLVKMDYADYGWTTTGGYWNSTTTNYNKCITTENNSSDSNTHKFVATKRFTKDELPIGSVIKIESGWQYRPEAWLSDTKQSSRPANVTTTYVKVTEEWWGNYLYRAFNVTNNTVLDSNANDPQFETAKSKLTIYVPTNQ